MKKALNGSRRYSCFPKIPVMAVSPPKKGWDLGGGGGGGEKATRGAKGAWDIFSLLYNNIFHRYVRGYVEGSFQSARKAGSRNI